MVKFIEIMFNKYLYKIGSRLRNPSLQKHFLFLKESNKWSLKELEDYQLEKLKEIINYAYRNSDYYFSYYNENNFHPSQIKTIEDIKKIPIVKKQDLIRNSSIIQTSIKGKTFKSSTSGTTGQSLHFFKDESADSFNRASIQRGYSCYNVFPWQKNGYFWGFNFDFSKKIKTLFLDFLQNRFRVFSYDNNELNNFIKKLSKASYVHGYSSMIYQVAKLINKNKITKPLNIKMVKGTSEKIYDSYQEEVIKAFGTKIISEYGAAETGIIAFECPEGNMHINMEGVIVEEINHEIVVTNLQMKSFPVIRYTLGDYIKLDEKHKKCKCGKQHLIIDEVTGRIGKSIYGFKGIYPSLYFYYIFKNIDTYNNIKLNYQVIQKDRGYLLVKIEQNLQNLDTEIIKKEFMKYFDTDIKLEIKVGCVLRSNNSKLKSFISLLDI
jgi:phenylacetate-CoA ligase